MARPCASIEDYRRLYDLFQAPVSRFDCGRKCAPLNGGEPVCCSTDHAVPVVDRAEWLLLRSRSDLWRRHKPQDAQGKAIAAALPRGCLAVECKGARHCERDNRSLACRSFPFFPYIDGKGTFIGLAVHWTFADRCWVMSNLGIVDAEFRRQFVAAYDRLFAVDRGEYEANKDHSTALRRVFSRRGWPIPLIGREGGYFKVMPHGRGMRPCRPEALPKYGPYRSARAWRAALAAASA